MDKPISRRALLSSFGTMGMAAMVMSGCGSADAGSGEGDSKIFRWGQSNAKVGLDMQRCTSAGAASIADAVCEPLLRYTEDLELEPVLLEKIPEWNEDGTVLQCKLKEGVKFHDGSDLTTADVKYTFERMMKPATGALSTYLFDSIKGASQMLAGEADELEGLEIVDDYNFAFHLEQPYVVFISNLATSYGEIFPHEACEIAGEDWGKGNNLIGTGPYKLVENDDSTHVTLTAHADWHVDTPYLEGVEVSFIDDSNTKMMSYVKGDIDACDLSIDLLAQYKDDPAVKDTIQSYMPLGTMFLTFNMKESAFADLRVRQAMSLAINRQELVDTVLNGSAQAASCFINPNIPGFDEAAQPYEYDPEKARELLKEAGAEGLSITMHTRSGLYNTVAVACQGYFDQVGINCEVQLLDNGVWSQEHVSGNLQLYPLSWNTLFPDADMLIYNFFSKEAATKKSSFYESDEFNKLVEDARVELDEAKRAEMYKQADNILTRQDVACIPLFYQKSNFVLNPNFDMKVGNLIYHFNDVKAL